MQVQVPSVLQHLSVHLVPSDFTEPLGLQVQTEKRAILVLINLREPRITWHPLGAVHAKPNFYSRINFNPQGVCKVGHFIHGSISFAEMVYLLF